jgi:hypothetical protein
MLAYKVGYLASPEPAWPDRLPGAVFGRHGDRSHVVSQIPRLTPKRLVPFQLFPPNRCDDSP